VKKEKEQFVRRKEVQQLGNKGGQSRENKRGREEKGVFILGLRFFLIHLGLCFNPNLIPKHFKLSPP
jgi:hypothetical protein